jgi:hypothetical protein
MAQVALSGIGRAAGGAPGAMIGAFIGQRIDQAVLSSLQPARQRGPRLDGLKLQSTSEGAPMACALGRARVVGQVIWAARFLEDRHTASAGKGGPRTVEYGYSLSFAVALCEGEIDGVGRIWADGQPMDLSGVTMRVHRGSETQAPDPLIEAVEGSAPAYRGTAYVVFEDLPLGPFGNRLPQLAFEVFNRPSGAEARLEDRLEGVCLIPAAGEFVFATEPVLRREGLTRTTPENVHAGDGRTDLVVSLDHLQAQLPNLKRVSLVIGWFGDDLRAGHCRVRPGVERVEKCTEPLIWSVAGLERPDAHLISSFDGMPAYGGTPSDESVRQAVAELKVRGLEVTLYLFVFMDVPAGNALPDPNGGEAQPAYPWRGRLRGRYGAHAADDVNAVFGDEDGWGLRRLALHYAALAAETGADGLLIGSEMRDLTMTRDAVGDFPAVAAFQALAAECRAVAGPTVRLSYAADWSEYAGVRAGDEVRFHLDPLWADPNIDYVGIDWYPPLGDWRAEDGGLDAATYDGPDDPLYLATQTAGGEGFEWFYASDADRAAQIRTPIIDTLANEHWVYRVKDLTGWWGHPHHERIGGVRQPSPTAWIAGMKPVRLIEFGCPAVDRGGNAPNLFQDPKSAEDALPPFSTGARDDRMQRRVLEAVLGHFEADNPTSLIYGGPMLEAADAWCWDARPWPAFPARDDVWADGAAWRCGHWLNGRLHGETRDLLHALLQRGGVGDCEIGAVAGEVDGYLVDRPMPTRDVLAPLLAGLGMTAVERGGRIAVIGDEPVAATLLNDAMALPDDGPALRVDRSLEIRPTTARVRFIDGARDYQVGSAATRRVGDGGALDLDLPAICGPALAEAAARRALAAGEGESLKATLGPLEALTLEPGDTVVVEGMSGRWCVTGIDVAETVSATLEPVLMIRPGEDRTVPAHSGEGVVVGPPFFRMLELPRLAGDDGGGGPLAVVAAAPWRPMQVQAGASVDALTLRAGVDRPATVGVLVSSVRQGPRHRWDSTTVLTVRIEGQAPQSRGDASVLAGANTLALETVAGWEVIQFRHADLVSDGVWRLSGLLRGQQGTEAAMRAGADGGAVVVFLDAALPRTLSSREERGMPLVWRAGPPGLSGGAGVSELEWTSTGVQDRPWSPVHLRRKVRSDGGLEFAWIPRVRVDGDHWDGEVAMSDPLRFRVSLGRDGEVRRAFEVEAAGALRSAVDLAADFPEGLSDGMTIGVAQWSDGYGWGEEATLVL